MAWINFKRELTKAINRAGIKKTIDATVIVEEAKKAIAETFEKNLAESVQPLFFKSRTLTVRASSSVVAQEVRLQERMLIDTINKNLGKEEVHYLSIRQ